MLSAEPSKPVCTRRAAKQERLASASESFRPTLARMFDLMPMPSEMPAFAGIMADPSGYLWVNSYSTPGENENSWDVFDDNGVLAGRVRLPARFTPHQIGNDFVLSVWRNDLDVEHVQLYDLIE